MKHALLIMLILALTGCHSTQSGGRLTVIAPQSTEEAPQPSVKWVKRDNVFYLEVQNPR